MPRNSLFSVEIGQALPTFENSCLKFYSDLLPYASKANEGLTILDKAETDLIIRDNEDFTSAVLKKYEVPILNKLKWWHYCENVNLVRHVFLT